jgi:hypothetical protein
MTNRFGGIPVEQASPEQPKNRFGGIPVDALDQSSLEATPSQGIINDPAFDLNRRFDLFESQTKPSVTGFEGTQFSSQGGAQDAPLSEEELSLFRETPDKRQLWLKKIRGINPVLADQIEGMSAGESFLVGSGKVANDVIQGFERLVGASSMEEAMQDEQAYNFLSMVRPSAGAGSMVTQAATFGVPLAKAAQIPNIAARVPSAFALGASEAGLIESGQGGDAGDIATSAAIGGTLTAAGGELFGSRPQSAARLKIKAMIEQGGKGKELVKYIGDTTLDAQDDAVVREGLKGAYQDKRAVKYLIDGSGRVKKDPLAKAALRQGYDEGTVSVIKGSSDVDKGLLRKMLNIQKKTLKDSRYGLTNRPSDVAGQSLAARVNFVKNTNKQAGKRLDSVAKSLKGKPVNYQDALDQFVNDLDDMGVSLSNQGGVKVSYQNSMLEGLDDAQGVVTRVLKRLTSTKPPDAFDVHRMKRFIDQQVTFGKKGDGLKGEAEGVIKKLRRNLDKSLDDAFPEYNQVNTQYADTIQVLDEFQTAAGRSMNLNSPNVDKALGTASRKLMSNYQSRVALMDSLDNMERVITKYGGNFDDDLLTQVLFFDELNTVFKPAARTSLQGEMGKVGQRVLRSGLTRETRAEAAMEGIQALRGINDDGAIRAMEDLLK